MRHLSIQEKTCRVPSSWNSEDRLTAAAAADMSVNSVKFKESNYSMIRSFPSRNQRIKYFNKYVEEQKIMGPSSLKVMNQMTGKLWVCSRN